MPWPDPPDDFREKYRSVWVDIPSALYDPVRGHELYNTYLDQLEFAETVGYDGLGRPAGGGLPGRHLDGHELRLWPSACPHRPVGN